jgi:hypothetical protein
MDASICFIKDPMSMKYFLITGIYAEREVRKITNDSETYFVNKLKVPEIKEIDLNIGNIKTSITCTIRVDDQTKIYRNLNDYNKTHKLFRLLLENELERDVRNYFETSFSFFNSSLSFHMAKYNIITFPEATFKLIHRVFVNLTDSMTKVFNAFLLSQEITTILLENVANINYSKETQDLDKYLSDKRLEMGKVGFEQKLESGYPAPIELAEKRKHMLTLLDKLFSVKELPEPEIENLINEAFGQNDFTKYLPA